MGGASSGPHTRSCLENDAKMVKNPRRNAARPATVSTSSSPRWFEPNRRKARESLSLLEPDARSIKAHMADDAGTYLEADGHKQPDNTSKIRGGGVTGKTALHPTPFEGWWCW